MTVEEYEALVARLGRADDDRIAIHRLELLREEARPPWVQAH